MMHSLAHLHIRTEHDVVLARQRAREIADALGFDTLDQTRIATAVSELARNAYQYAAGGTITFSLADETGRNRLVARISDQGPGIPHLDRVLDGSYVSRTGMGMGLLGARRMADAFDVRSAPGEGTVVEVVKNVPPARTGAEASLAVVASRLRAQAIESELRELETQNREVLQLMEELRHREADVERLNAELDETNRGVMALYAELDDRAEDLKRASEMKTRFLSGISHELRTPLTSVMNMTRLLLDRVDGELTSEQEHQVQLIRQSVSNLMEMVNDLLDIARIEAGKSVLRLGTVRVSEVLSALRGMFRAVVAQESVPLVFEEPNADLTLYTDEGKLSQVLRNFISNALKFTLEGSVHVRVQQSNASTVVFSVEDTGIGLDPEDQRKIFDEFYQVEGTLQSRSRGTGLGLPISRSIAEMLGGYIEVRSTKGVGSTFSLVLPLLHPSSDQQPATNEADGMADHTTVPDE